MLKKIDNIFERRRKSLDKSQEIIKNIKDNLQLFFKERFGEDIKGLLIKIEYQSKDNSLIINTPSKVLANELTLNLLNIEDSLKKDKLKVDQILIR